MIFRAMDDFSSDSERKNTMNRLLKYIKTDSVIYRLGEPEELVKLQDDYLNPIVEHVKQKYGYSLMVTDSLFAVQQPEGIQAAMTKQLESLSPIQLSAFEKATLYSKSFFIPLALMDGAITVEQAMNASRVELIHQLKKWGTVPESHPLDEADLKRQLSAAACCRMSNE
jgi:ATP synthase F1 complex assembly factor 2